MKRPTILAGILFAFSVAVLAAPAWWGLRSLVPFQVAIQTALMIVYLGYLAYLLRSKGSGIGTVTLTSTNVVLALMIAWAPLTLMMKLVILAVLLTLNRSLLWHRTLAALLLDGTLTALGLLFAGYLYDHSWSLAASLWGFLLLQSLWVSIPTEWSWRREPEFPHGDPIDPFLQSHRQAESALQRMGSEG